jgi:hypothetical protein
VLFYGYEVFGKASSGTTTLFSSKIKVPEGGGDFVSGWHQKVNPNTPPDAASTSDQCALLDLGYSRSASYVSDTAVSPDKARRYFDRFRAIAAYNKIRGRFALGSAVGAERRNNLDDLMQVTFETTVIPAPANTTTSIVKTRSGFLGAYREYVAAPIYTDIVHLVPKLAAPGLKKTSIAIDGFTRSNLAATNRAADGGLGIFATKKGAPTKVIGSIAASWNGGKVKVALVASYVLSFCRRPMPSTGMTIRSTRGELQPVRYARFELIRSVKAPFTQPRKHTY